MHFPSNTSREWNAPWENKQHSCAKTVLTIKALKKAAACQEDTRRVHAGIHTCMSACTHFCLSSGQARKIQWSMCSPRERKRRGGGGQGVPSSWVIFNHQYNHAKQKDLQPSHPPKNKPPTIFRHDERQPIPKPTQAVCPLIQQRWYYSCIPNPFSSFNTASLWWIGVCCDQHSSSATHTPRPRADQ